MRVLISYPWHLLDDPNIITKLKISWKLIPIFSYTNYLFVYTIFYVTQSKINLQLTILWSWRHPVTFYLSPIESIIIFCVCVSFIFIFFFLTTIFLNNDISSYFFIPLQIFRSWFINSNPRLYNVPKSPTDSFSILDTKSWIHMSSASELGSYIWGIVPRFRNS